MSGGVKIPGVPVRLIRIRSRRNASAVVTAVTGCLYLACGLHGASAFAQQDDKKDPPRPTFEALDANKDGRISVSEARKDKFVAARFAAADLDQNGYLDREEFQKLISQR